MTRRSDDRERWVAKDRARRAADGLPTQSVRRKIGNEDEMYSGRRTEWQVILTCFQKTTSTVLGSAGIRRDSKGNCKKFQLISTKEKTP